MGRIESLAIPPAWTEVWICRDPRGHIQATGRDARGRKQYRYHPAWASLRDQGKYRRMVAFARALRGIRRRVQRDLALPGLPRERSLAAVVRLLDATHIRVGNSEYARDNDSFGLATLRRRHVAVRGGHIRLCFAGEGGKSHDVELHDPAVAGVIRECLRRPGPEVFKYVDEDGRVCDVGASDVNAYLRQVAEGDFTAKDFRTWAATVTVVRELQRGGDAGSAVERKQRLLAAIDVAAAHLNNTRAICRRSYVHPAVVRAWLEAGNLTALAGNGRPQGRAAARRAIARVLRIPEGL